MKTQTPTIALPSDLLPGDGRFGCGPSKVRPEAVAALDRVAPSYLGTSHRRDGVRKVVGRIRTGMTELFDLPDGYEVLLGNGGATLFFDAAAYGLIDHRSQHLVFGEFSAKFAESAAAPHLEAPEIIKTDPGTHPSSIPNPEVDVYGMTQNETSTGVAMTVTRPTGDGLVVVDATSAAGGTRVDPAQFDCYFFSPQKAFAGDAGLWLALCSPAAIERIGTIGASGRYVPPILSLPIALDNSRLNQTYNTPALASLLFIADTTEWMNENGGLAWSAARCDESSGVLYDWAEASEFAMPFVSNPAERSHTVATIDFVPEVDAATVAATLRANGIVDTEPYRKLGRNQLRIALFPAIEPDDVAALTACIDYVVDRLG
ncbi:MAG TPA: phosphoserine transaminase, partial [Actinomycetota bacterium]|nr:phosphoserine transaminase [Actinomycetota bacterium]